MSGESRRRTYEQIGLDVARTGAALCVLGCEIHNEELTPLKLRQALDMILGKLTTYREELMQG